MHFFDMKAENTILFGGPQQVKSSADINMNETFAPYLI